MATKVELLNKINVFPIADGDTGANMKVCLKLPTRNLLLPKPCESILDVACNMAADVLLNGQGNSGTILSHFFVSLAEEIKSCINKNTTQGGDADCDSLSVDEFAQCLIQSGSKMAHAVPNPVEGTLLSVCRDACRLLEQNRKDKSFANLHELLEAWNTHAQTELAKTPNQLVVNGVHVLKQAGVVDSGAQGFVYVVEGMWLAAQGQLPEARDPTLFQPAQALAAKDDDDNMIVTNDDHHTACDSKYQYCTEAVIVLKDGATKEQVMEMMDECINENNPRCQCHGGDENDGLPLGDSLVCVGAPAKEGGDMVKLHIHTNQPQVFFDKLKPFSRDEIFKKEKVEDMYVMRQHAHETLAEYRDYSDAKFTLMGMCSQVLPPIMQSDDLFTLPVFVVPSTTQEPIDIRFATDSETTQALNQQRHPQTAIRYTTASSNPMQMKIELLAALAKCKPILVVIMSKDKKMSAFGRNVIQAVDLLEPHQQKMVKILCHGWGLNEVSFLTLAMRMAKEGKTIDETYEACQDHAARTFAFCNFAASPTVAKLVAWRPGLFPKGFTVQEGSYTTFGIPSKLRTVDEIPEADRVGKLMNVLGSATDLEAAMDQEAQRIKDTLEPGQSIGDILISCVGRPDHGHKFLDKLRSVGVSIVGDPVVYNGGFIVVALSTWGEFTVVYKIIEA